ALRAEDPSYAYQRLGELLARIAARVELREYARTAELHRLLFTLADALFAIGARTPARDLWRALSADPEAGAWGRRAASQLRSPVVKVPALP
ncbi:MAG TPA: hypothetical protein VLH39_02190, partial [Magnetospirillaceae bacterium]|nr:hypothetical protein [Magnetospirillaceae bacterium]